MNDLGKQLVVGFFISIALHGAFIFFAGMQYREQVKNIFWIDALVKIGHEHAREVLAAGDGKFLFPPAT